MARLPWDYVIIYRTIITWLKPMKVSRPAGILTCLARSFQQAVHPSYIGEIGGRPAANLHWQKSVFTLRVNCHYLLYTCIYIHNFGKGHYHQLLSHEKFLMAYKVKHHNSCHLWDKVSVLLDKFLMLVTVQILTMWFWFRWEMRNGLCSDVVAKLWFTVTTK